MIDWSWWLQQSGYASVLGVHRSPNNALHRTGLALRARPSLASLGAGERGR
jgi:hypothetical protein